MIATPGAAHAAGEAISRWWSQVHPGAVLEFRFFSVADAYRSILASAYNLLMFLLPPGIVLLVLSAAGFVGTIMLGTDSRRTELAVRRALGATIPRIGRQLLLGCLMVAVPAAVLATIIGATVTRTTTGVRALWAVVGSAAGLSFVFCLVCSLLGAAYPL